MVVDLRLRREGLEALQDPAHELGHVGRGGGPGAGQRHVHHEDVGQDTGEGGESGRGEGEGGDKEGRDEEGKEKTETDVDETDVVLVETGQKQQRLAV